jgi:hypothetical protein
MESQSLGRQSLYLARLQCAAEVIQSLRHSQKAYRQSLDVLELVLLAISLLSMCWGMVDFTHSSHECTAVVYLFIFPCSGSALWRLSTYASPSITQPLAWCCLPIMRLIITASSGITKVRTTAATEHIPAEHCCTALRPEPLWPHPHCSSSPSAPRIADKCAFPLNLPCQ